MKTEFEALNEMHNRQGRKLYLAEQENAQLRARIAELQDERDTARSQRLTALDLIVTTQTKIAELEAQAAQYEQVNKFHLDLLIKKDAVLASIASDLQAARTAAGLAQSHTNALEQLMIEQREMVRELYSLWPDRDSSRYTDLERRAKELLGEMSLTPSKAEQLESLVKAYEYFVVQYFTTKDSKAEEARDMLIEQYNRLIGEVKHA